MNYEISSGFVLVNSNTKKILILKLSKEFEWDLPKGHQEKGETIIETAYREVEEEIGINKSQIQILKDNSNQIITDFYEYTSPVSQNIRQIHLFIGLINENPIISNEHCGFAWCNLEESLSYLKFKDVGNSVKKLYNNYILSEK